MSEYLLSLHSATDRPSAMTEEEMAQSWAKVSELEADMKSAGAWLMSGRLTEPDIATVVTPSGEDVVMTDGPFAETKEHLAGFYIIRANDLDDALSWASRVTAAVAQPIEVRAFFGLEGPQ